MGCASSKHRPMEQPVMYAGGYMQPQPIMYAPEPVMPAITGNGYLASEAFLADWTRFIHGQTPAQFEQGARVDSSVFPVHEAGRDWAEQTLQRMHQDLEGMGIGGDYNYDQNGDEKSGEIVIECKTTNHGGPDISKIMRWKLQYEIANDSQPQMMMQQQPQMMMQQQPQMMMQQQPQMMMQQQPQMMMQQQPQMMMQQQPQMMMQQPQMMYAQ